MPGSWRPLRPLGWQQQPQARSVRQQSGAGSTYRIKYTNPEARQRSKGGKHTSTGEPVLSYQQIFQDAGAGKGFSKARTRKAGGGKGGTSGGPGAATDTDAASVHFCMARQLEFGQGLRLCGSAPELGEWDHTQGPELAWHEGHKWSAEVPLPAGGHEFKFVLVHRSGFLEWEPGSNRAITVPKTAAELQVVGKWGATEDTEVLELQQQASYRQELMEQLEKQLQEQAAEAAPAAPEEQQPAEQPRARSGKAAPAAAAAADSPAAEDAAGGGAARAAIPASALAADEELLALDWTQLDTAVPENRHLMQVLLGFKQDMVDGLSGVTLTMQEIQDELAQVQQQVARLAAAQVLEPAARHAGGGGALPSELALPFASDGAAAGAMVVAGDAASIPADAAGGKDQALSGLHTAVLSWRQELLSFREDSLGLRQELEELRQGLEAQMAENTAAVHDLELLVKHLISTSGGAPPPAPAARAGGAQRAAEGWSPAPPGAQGGAGAGAPAPEASEVLDAEDRLLLERINHLASDLSVEMKEAVQELELQQQTLLERHQHIVANRPGSNGSSRGGSRPGSPLASTWDAAPAGMGSMVPIAARWLESREAQLWYRGLLATAVMSCGLWSAAMWDELQGQAFKSTWEAYTRTWSDACLQTWKDAITTKRQLLTALNGGRQQLLAMHLLWSLQELGSHSPALADALAALGTPIELGLMQKLWQKGGVDKGWALGVAGAPVGGGEAAAAAQCAVVLQRWLAASETNKHGS